MSKLQAATNPSETELQLIVELYSRGDFKKALSLSTKLASHFNESATLFNLCGAIQAALSQYASAIESYKRAIEIEPNFSYLYFNMASAQFDSGDLDAAIKSYRKAIAIEPTYTEAYSDLGLALQGKELWHEAIDCFNHALTLNPYYADAHSNKGYAMQAIGNLEAAKTSCKKALDINPDLSAAHYNLGSVLHQQGELTEALSSYRRVCEIDPNLTSAFVNCGRILQELGDLNGAIGTFNTALSIDPSFADAHFSLATAFHDNGSLNSAHASYRRALELDPSHAFAALNIAKLLFENQQYAQASDIFALNETTESQLYLLKCLYAQKSQTEVSTQIKKLCINGEHSAVIGSYVSRAKNKYGLNLHNPFCQDPLDFIRHISLLEKVDFANTFGRFASTLLTCETTNLRAQTLLTNGVQTAGNCFTQGGELGRSIEEIIRTEIERYREIFSSSSEGLIHHWPEKYRLFGWLVSVRKGGKLAAHMHDNGWLTGSVYISVPQKDKPDSGNLVVSAEDVDDEEAISGNRRSIDVVTGSLCLFPSSLLHYTRPFDTEEKRIVLAFDMIPI